MKSVLLHVSPNSLHRSNFSRGLLPKGFIIAHYPTVFFSASQEVSEDHRDIALG